MSAEEIEGELNAYAQGWISYDRDRARQLRNQWLALKKAETQRQAANGKAKR